VSAAGAAPRIVVESSGSVLLATDRPVVFGGRSCDVVLDDPVVADRHCQIAFEDGFRVRDLGSVTGTWVDGKAARPTAVVADGSEIVLGVSKLAARIEARDGVSTLVLDLQRQAFWWKRPGKGVFDNDPDALVRSEVEFGRFPALQFGNRLAMITALVLLVAATFVAAVMEPLADPGTLLPSHARVADLAAGKVEGHAAFADFTQLAATHGCNVCHTTGAGTPGTKCLECHQDLADASTRRHPFVVDGKLGPVPGMAVDDAFCSVCHRDHFGAEFLKPASARLLGNCAACHSDGSAAFDLAKLRAVRELPPPERQRPYATYRFPHDAHLKQEHAIGCAVCHRPDPVAAAKFAAGAADPDLDDFAEVPFELCASCHVPGSTATNMSLAEQTQFRSKAPQWPVSWHGTDDAAKNCAPCHAEEQRGGRTVFGPGLRLIERPAFDTAQHAAERARYVVPRRSHQQELAHAGGKDCATCHVSGSLAKSEPPARPFWHALHVADGGLAPAAGTGGATSINAKNGCISCHADLQQSENLRLANQGAYQWPADAEAQAACKECHREGDAPLLLQPRDGPIGPDRRAQAPDFPHGVHVRSESFGKQDTALAEGCFSCHEFAANEAGRSFEIVPRTKAKAADCTQCHTGHDHIAGNSCGKCHPAEPGRSNSFLQAALIAEPAAPQRSWPGKNRFLHDSRGHVGPDITCVTCHGETRIEAANALDATLRVPDESTLACRECHLRTQFHWR